MTTEKLSWEILHLLGYLEEKAWRDTYDYLEAQDKIGSKDLSREVIDDIKRQVEKRYNTKIEV